MKISKAAFWTVLAFFLAGFSWENPSPSGDTVSPGESARSEDAPLVEHAPAADEPENETAALVEEEASPAEEAAPPQNLKGAKVSLYVNDAKNQHVYRGWPFFVKVVVENPSGKVASPVVLEKGAKAWADAVDIEVKDEKGRLHDWPFRLAPVTKLGRRVQLDSGEALTLVFLISGEQMRAKAGTYTLEASLSGTARTDGSVVVHVDNHPESLTDEQEKYRDKLSAIYDLLTGKRNPPPPPQPAPAPQIIYVQQPSSPAQSEGGAEAMSGILGLVSEFGMGGAMASGDYGLDAASDFTDYTSEE